MHCYTTVIRDESDCTFVMIFYGLYAHFRSTREREREMRRVKHEARALETKG